MKPRSIQKIVYSLVTSLFIAGIFISVAGFFGLIFPILTVILLLPVFFILQTVFKGTHSLYHASNQEKIILLLIAAWWFLHSLQVFVPETGFDALWYHLPVAQGVVTNNGFYIDRDMYQSFNPLFSDGIFYLGFMAGGEVGAKLVAYMLALSLLLVSYQLARKMLNREMSLIAVLLISGFQVISWQSASFYVDITKAFWEVSALWFLLKNHRHAGIKSGLAFGASLATKVFSIMLLPLVFCLTLINKSKREAVLILAVSLLIALPYYLFSYSASGNPIYSAFHHVDKLNEIGGTSQPINYLIQRTVSLPFLPVEMLVTREYLSPLLILIFPLSIMYRKKIANDKTLLSLTVFTLFQLLIWWYLPPLSVRYALSGFITATILSVYLLQVWWREMKYSEKKLFLVLVILGVLFMPVRLLVAKRSINYLVGNQTKEQYLQQFLDGNIDNVLKEWHHL